MLFSEDMMARLCQAMPLDTPIRIVDVGASNIARERPSYDPLLARSLGHLTAFEPNPAEFAKLPSGAQRRYLPYAIGDGHEAPFHVTLSPGLCSTLKPNTRITRHLKFLDRLSEVVSHETMLTHRLDDIAELGDIDFLKIDIQGGELKVFQGGRNRLANALCIQTEIAFVPIYEDQPLFADQDSMLQSLGLRFYGMASVNRFPMAGSSRKVRRKQRETILVNGLTGTRFTCVTSPHGPACPPTSSSDCSSSSASASLRSGRPWRWRASLSRRVKCRGRFTPGLRQSCQGDGGSGSSSRRTQLSVNATRLRRRLLALSGVYFSVTPLAPGRGSSISPTRRREQ